MSEQPVYRTKSGKILTDEDIQALADEAEIGYEIAPGAIRLLTDEQRTELRQRLAGGAGKKELWR